MDRIERAKIFIDKTENKQVRVVKNTERMPWAARIGQIGVALYQISGDIVVKFDDDDIPHSIIVDDLEAV